MTIKAQIEASDSTRRRISRTELYMEMAALFSQRSTCLRGQVGCVAVKDNHIIAAGYNGAPPGMPHCMDVGCGGGVDQGSGLAESIIFPNGCTRAIHAEMNMVAFAARHGISLDGCAVFSTCGPCLPCAQAMISAGTRVLVYETPYRLPQGLELMLEANIEAVRYR